MPQRMRRLAVAALVASVLASALAPLPLAAADGSAAPLPSPVFLDGEADAHFPAFLPGGGRSFLARVSFDATMSNSVQIAIGSDGDGDGVLSLRESALFAGWDRGEWFVRRATASGWESVSAPGDIGRRMLKLRRRTRDTSSAEIATLEIDGKPSVFSFEKNWLPLDLLDAPDALVRVAVRSGAGETVLDYGSALVGEEADTHVIAVR
jgi:hypothetical protein